MGVLVVGEGKRTIVDIIGLHDTDPIICNGLYGSKVLINDIEYTIVPRSSTNVILHDAIYDPIIYKECKPMKPYHKFVGRHPWERGGRK